MPRARLARQPDDGERRNTRDCDGDSRKGVGDGGANHREGSDRPGRERGDEVDEVGTDARGDLWI